MVRRLLLFPLLFLATASLFATKPSFERVDPPNWWVGMQNSRVELLIKGENLEGITAVGVKEAGVIVERVIPFPNTHYLGVILNIDATAQPGTLHLSFKKEKETYSLEYDLLARNVDPERQVGLLPSDFIYLVFPDRFSNGDPSNDQVNSMHETSLDRDSMFLRHGGDIEGISNKLDYFEELGVTALWINPLQENNQPKESYHGYAITDHYKIDARFGSNHSYRQLVKDANMKGIKMIMDVVYNHWGDRHYLNQDPPAPDWIHHWKKFTRTNYRAPLLLDPYVAPSEKKVFTDGWFDHHMPDLNQNNPHLAKYLIQQTIWWIEYAGLEGLRIDTYAYSDEKFMQDMVADVLREYPQIGIFGETWVHGMGIQSYFMENQSIHPKHNSNLPGVTDFQLYYAINDALTKEMGWTEGISRMYYTLAQDYLYQDANKNILFLDNHDLSRFYSMIGEDLKKYKMGIAWLLTMRGIPMMYYGTEILMKNFADPDGKVREDFPGGWDGDVNNKFEESARSSEENEAFKYVKILANWRKTSSTIATGKLMQYVPQDGLYVYFRYDESSTVMIAMNCSKDSKELKPEQFPDVLQPYTIGKDVVTGKQFLLTSDHMLEPYTTKVVEFKK